MTVVRLIPLATRSGLLMLAGTALIVAPLGLGLGVAAIVTGVVIGALAVGLGVAGTDSDGRGTLPVSAQAVYDRGLALGLLLAGVVFGLADETDAMALFAVAGFVALVVSTVTRYSARPT
ncbi:MAG TPA: hypothetical protein VGF25_21990 [Thermoleophilaceae bacterium]|jgi:hypothetical protein